jgi:hypothetical protein
MRILKMSLFILLHSVHALINRVLKKSKNRHLDLFFNPNMYRFIKRYRKKSFAYRSAARTFIVSRCVL